MAEWITASHIWPAREQDGRASRQGLANLRGIVVIKIDRGQTTIMQLKLCTDLIDALGKVAGGLKAIVNMPNPRKAEPGNGFHRMGTGYDAK